jgi:threonine dehydratase
MWPYVSQALDGAYVVSVEETVAALRMLALQMKVVAEGAGALSLAAALAGHGEGKTVAVVSGGNIDAAVLSRILAGEVPA